MRDLKRFVGRAILLLLPLAVWCAAIAAIDPFDYFRVSHLIPHASKEQAAGTLNEALWKVIEIDHGVGPNVLIGGSKMARITPEIVKRVTGQDYQSLAIGGAPVVEMIELFWYATKHGKLENVVLGVSFDTVNRYNQKNRVIGAEATAKDPLLYLVNRDVASTALNLVKATWFGGQLASGHPDMTRELFWQHELTDWVERRFKMYGFDDAAFAKLEEVAQYCKDHKIHLKVLVLPNHFDIHEKIKALGLEDEWHLADSKLAGLGEGYDFDVDNEMTRDRDHFTDPFHFDATIAERIVRKAWGLDP